MLPRSFRSVLLASVVAVTLVIGSQAAPAAATGPPHTSCAGGATRAPEVGLPAPGPAFGAALAAQASTTGGLGDEAQQLHALLCTPKS
ncbi:MAG: hypothetical protein ACJ789_11060 [Thermomicrobiales bacterium]